MGGRTVRNRKALSWAMLIALAGGGLEAHAEASQELTNKVWMLENTTDAPGSMWIFLEDGTLVRGSCTEPYSLAEWRREKEGMLVITEAETETPAIIADLTNTLLRLRLSLVDDTKLERIYRYRPGPFTCPAEAE